MHRDNTTGQSLYMFSVLRPQDGAVDLAYELARTDKYENHSTEEVSFQLT